MLRATLDGFFLIFSFRLRNFQLPIITSRNLFKSIFRQWNELQNNFETVLNNKWNIEQKVVTFYREVFLQIYLKINLPHVFRKICRPAPKKQFSWEVQENFTTAIVIKASFVISTYFCMSSILVLHFLFQ